MNGPRDRGHDPDRGKRSDGFAILPVPERFALDQLKRNVLEPRVFPDVIDLHDIRMVNPGRSLRLGAKPCSVQGTGVRTGEDDLQRHQTIQALLSGLVNDTHPATAQLAKNLVTREVDGC